MQKNFYQGNDEEFNEISNKLASLHRQYPQFNERVREEKSALEREKAETYVNLLGLTIKSDSSEVLSISGAHLLGVQVVGNFSSLEGEKLCFKDGIMKNVVLENFRLLDCNFQDINAESIQIKKNYFRGVSFKEAKLQGAKFGADLNQNTGVSDGIRGPESTVSNSGEHHGFMHSVDFNGADLQNVHFFNLKLFRDVKFQSTNLRNAIFNNVKVGNVGGSISFIGASLDSCQFKNCTFVQVSWINFENIDPAKLKIQLDSLQCMWAGHSPEDRARLTKTIFSDFKSEIEKIKDQELKGKLLECAQLPIFGYEEKNPTEKKSTLFMFVEKMKSDIFQSGERKWIEGQRANINPKTGLSPF